MTLLNKIKKNFGSNKRFPNIRLRNVISLARRCHYPEAHSRHVAKLAISLFDQTHPLHGLGDCEREWLEYAALLHDIGYVIHPRQHHKHSYYLIKNSNVAGFRADEIEMIASIARYHRRALPDQRHPAYETLPKQGQRVLSMLSAILRIADGLDRSHFSIIQNLQVILEKDVTIRLKTAGDSELEIWTAQSRSDLFEKVFKRKVSFLTEKDAEE